MPADLSPLISATTQWLVRAYPSGGGTMAAALADAQARQAVTVAAWLRYPTSMDAALVQVAGPGGSSRLDWITGADNHESDDPTEHAWRTWVDEVVASWATVLLTTPELAAAALAAVEGSVHLNGAPVEFRRLLAPDAHDRRSAALLRHPDLVAPIADLHRTELLDLLKPSPS
ncbi:hypothetical protein [Streptomyces orinoci]|uniref:Uncharacterized protein n=1 Tax=Streptomyces orinoci TaxID=67339 RepID=A0ABV3K4P0_STRON|nr:hypothetical protein [Streptomyces orinoci]